MPFEGRIDSDSACNRDEKHDDEQKADDFISGFDFEAMARSETASAAPQNACAKPVSPDPFPYIEDEVEQESKGRGGDRRSKLDDSDLNEEFGEGEERAILDEKAWRKRWAEIEIKMHSIDFSVNEQFRIRACPLVREIIKLMAEELGIAQGDLCEYAIMMFYMNFFTPQKNVVADLTLALDSFGLSVNELTLEASHMSDLALAALEAEAAPNYVLEGSEE